MKPAALYHCLSAGRLRHGPFRGMRYVRSSVGSSYGAKLLGTYELELRGVIDSLGPVPSIINVGGGEGYYAVGLALRNPAARVRAYETDPRGQGLIRQLAALNDVSDRIEVYGTCQRETLRNVLAENPLIFMDAEGAELELLDLATLPKLADCTFLVETHEFIVPGVTDRLRERFAGTHKVLEIPTQPRTLRDLPLAFQWLFRMAPAAYVASVLDEGRPAPMSWLYLEPKGARA